jgi:hypothetical protein
MNTSTNEETIFDFAPAEQDSKSILKWDTTRIRAELRKLADGNPDPITLNLGIAELAKNSGVGKKPLNATYTELRNEVLAERQPPPALPSVPTADEITEQEAQRAKEEADQTAQAEFKKKVEERASEIAESTDVIAEFQKALLLCCNYIADRSLAGTLLVSQIGRKLNRNSGYLCDGTSGSGKSTAVGNASTLLPPEDIIPATNLTKNAIYYMGNLSGKYIIAGELVKLKPGDDDETQIALRQFISEGKITKISVGKDKDGNNASETLTVEGPAVVVWTTTAEASAFNPEFINRLTIFHTDASEEATENILNRSAKAAAALPDPKIEREIDIEREAWRTYHRQMPLLKTIVIPFAEEIIPTSRLIGARRLESMIFNYTYAFALARYKKRTVNTERSYLLAEKDDYKTAYELLKINAPRTMDSIQKRCREFFAKFKRLPGVSEGITVEDASTVLNLCRSDVQKFLTPLFKAGCVSRDEKIGKAYLYKFEKDAPDETDHGLIDPALISPTVPNCSDAREQLDSIATQGLSSSVLLLRENDTTYKNISLDV